MSADIFVAYYGVRYAVTDNEASRLEDRTHPIIEAARRAHLKCYWGNFGGMDRQDYLFIGTELAILGIENRPAFDISDTELIRVIEETKVKLRGCNIEESP